MDIRYTPNVRFTGKTGYDFQFDFAIPKSRQAPERLLRAINNPTKETAQTMILAWVDTKDVRTQDSRAFAVLNDSERQVSLAVVEALRNYDVVPVHWSRRGDFVAPLAA